MKTYTNKSDTYYTVEEEKACCNNCYYWDSKNRIKSCGKQLGSCKRFPPQVFYNRYSDRVCESVPSTTEDWFCGEFLEK